MTEKADKKPQSEEDRKKLERAEKRTKDRRSIVEQEGKK